MRKIEKPKVFISYAWGDEIYQNKVLSFATALVNDGIDVVLDKWDLSEGNDTYAFMEKCVLDPSITNVLILLDPVYAKKADGRTGGVGTETQIISAEVYGKVGQDKFLPIVFERNKSDEICKPTYLKSILHFDLSKEGEYNLEYQRLVRCLYGVETYKKPQLGSKPEWVESPQAPSAKTITQYDRIRNSDSVAEKTDLFLKSLDSTKDMFFEYGRNNTSFPSSTEEYLEAYAGMREIRNEYLSLLSYYGYVEGSIILVGDFLEEIGNIAISRECALSEPKCVFIHELFIYTIACMIKTKDYQSAGYLLGRTYFNNQSNEAENYTFFYSAAKHTNLDNCICKCDSKTYYSGTAAYWLQTLDAKSCSQSDFVLADLLCFNYSILGRNYRDSWKWFPILYPYGGGYDCAALIRPIATHMQSREFLTRFIPLFGYDNIDSFVEKLNEAKVAGDLDKYRFPSSFSSAPALIRLMKIEEVGMLP